MAELIQVFIAISVTVSFLVMGSAMKHTSKLTNSHKLLMKDEGRPCDITIGLRKLVSVSENCIFWNFDISVIFQLWMLLLLLYLIL